MLFAIRSTTKQTKEDNVKILNDYTEINHLIAFKILGVIHIKISSEKKSC